MKKIALILAALLALSANAHSEFYHAVDIDTVYKSSDWSSKEDIKKIIDDYSLLLQYQQELSQCSISTEKMNCTNTLAEKIIKNFYSHDYENNIKAYNDYIKATSAAYGVVYCLNKYRVPSGTMCNQENAGKVEQLIEQYINDLLQSIEKVLLGYGFLSDYKK